VGYLELEQFTLAAGVTRTAFAAVDDGVQAWSYVHRDGLRRRTTAFAEDGGVLVVSLFATAPAPLALDAPTSSTAPIDDGLEALRSVIEPGSYRRRVFEDRG
jgi:predicted benzoate:H+ symporter BenE